MRKIFHATNASASQYGGMVDRSSQSSACVACGFRLHNARNASDCVACVWMETGLSRSVVGRVTVKRCDTACNCHYGHWQLTATCDRASLLLGLTDVDKTKKLKKKQKTITCAKQPYTSDTTDDKIPQNRVWSLSRDRFFNSGTFCIYLDQDWIWIECTSNFTKKLQRGKKWLKSRVWVTWSI